MYLQKVKFALTALLVFVLLLPIFVVTESVVPTYQARIVLASAIVVALVGAGLLVYRVQAW